VLNAPVLSYVALDGPTFLGGLNSIFDHFLGDPTLSKSHCAVLGQFNNLLCRSFRRLWAYSSFRWPNERANDASSQVCTDIKQTNPNTGTEEFCSEVLLQSAALRARADEVLVSTHLNLISVLIGGVNDTAPVVTADR
jgi:hypothetical protein